LFVYRIKFENHITEIFLNLKIIQKGEGMSLCIIGGKKTASNLMLLEEGKKIFKSVLFVPINGIRIGLEKEFSIKYRTTDLLKFGCILPRVPHKLYSYGYQLLSLFPKKTFIAIKPISFLISEERFFLLSMLRKKQIPTIGIHLSRSSKVASNILKETSFPVIIRTPNKKTGMVARNFSEAKSIMDAIESLKEPIIIEDVIRDFVSVYVSYPDVVAAFRKIAKEGDLMLSKGVIEKCDISTEIEKLILDALDVIEASVARVDITTDPEPRIVNIELNPSIKKATDVSGINIAKRIMENVYKNYQEHSIKQKPIVMEFIEDAKSVVKDLTKKALF
jgi:glutathione synthase/RimK-type ligase-like ATP-grasp enzyme